MRKVKKRPCKDFVISLLQNLSKNWKLNQFPKFMAAALARGMSPNRSGVWPVCNLRFNGLQPGKYAQTPTEPRTVQTVNPVAHVCACPHHSRLLKLLAASP